MRSIPLTLFITLSLLIGCTQDQPLATYIVRLVVDGSEYVYQHSEPITVEQFLREVNIELAPLDRVNPEPWTQIFDNIRITVVRVVEQTECEIVDVPYRQEVRLVEGLAPGEERVGQAGQIGSEEVCYRIRIEDGAVRDRIETTRIVQQAPQNEILYVGPTEQLEPVAINGSLAYISNRNAWIIRGSSTAKRPLTVTGDLDSRVFSLSEDGRQLLIARHTADFDTFANQLWLIPNTVEDRAAIELTPRDVLYAEWVPGEPNTISYSSAEPRQAPPGWQAKNDLVIMRIDPQSGERINFREVIERNNGGLYGWWGTQYSWSSDGNRLAWVRADSVGLVNLETGELEPPLLQYAVFNPLQDWSWRASVSWSPDVALIATSVHGPPFGNERPESSPVFNVAIAAVDGSFSVDLVERAGIWSNPIYSPPVIVDDQRAPSGYLAYLRARDWNESIRGEYDLIVADRDGSNARVIFPPAGQPGLSAQRFVLDFDWSPDGRQLALIYLGNLWIVDVETGASHQLTVDGGASQPVWRR